MRPSPANAFTVTEKWLQHASVNDIDLAISNIHGHREILGEWYGCKLSSVFQAIVDSGSGRTHGQEAFLRCHGNGQRDLSPWSLFSANATDERLVAFDRLVRIVHALNFRGAFSSDNLLFLNVHGRLLAAVDADHGAFFRRTLESQGIAPEHVVIETPTAASHQTELLAFVLRNYRNNGFRVAVNVDSAAQWQLICSRIDTDFVKIDARSVLDAGDPGRGELDWLHTLGGEATLILTHLEARLSEPQRRSGTWAQGFAYGHPRPRSGAPKITNRYSDLMSA